MVEIVWKRIQPIKVGGRRFRECLGKSLSPTGPRFVIGDHKQAAFFGAKFHAIPEPGLLQEGLGDTNPLRVANPDNLGTKHGNYSVLPWRGCFPKSDP